MAISVVVLCLSTWESYRLFPLGDGYAFSSKVFAENSRKINMGIRGNFSNFCVITILGLILALFPCGGFAEKLGMDTAATDITPDGNGAAMDHVVENARRENGAPAHTDGLPPSQAHSAVPGLTASGDTHGVAAQPAVPAVANPLSSAANAANNGVVSTGPEVTRANSNTDFYRRTADLGSDWKSDLANRLNRIRAEARGAEAGPPEEREKFISKLRDPINPPQKLAELYNRTGLSTNEDLLKDGDRIQKNLDAGVQADKKATDYWKQQATLGQAAMMKMQRLADDINQKSANLSSISKEFGARTQSKGSNGLTTSTIALAGGQNSATGDSSKEGKSAADPKKGSLGQSISDLLKKKFAGTPKDKDDAKVKDKRNKDDVELAMKSILENALLEKATADKESSGKEAAEGKPGQRGFGMNGSETDAAVKALMKEYEQASRAAASQGAQDKLLGSDTVSLFERVKTALNKCQTNKCIARN